MLAAINLKLILLYKYMHDERGQRFEFIIWYYFESKWHF